MPLLEEQTGMIPDNWKSTTLVRNREPDRLRRERVNAVVGGTSWDDTRQLEIDYVCKEQRARQTTSRKS